MYIVLEIQEETAGGTPNTITYNMPTLSEAKSKYHYVLHYAAISNLYRHSAVLMQTDGRYIEQESFLHPGGDNNGAA